MRFRNPETRLGRVVTGGTAALASLALLASGCGSSSSQNSDKTPIRGGDNPTLTFDDLGGGSSVIEVFPSPRSDQYDGTYYDGDRATAICKTEGRERQSDPSVGELARQSDEWIRIVGTPGEQQFATAVYVEHPQHLLAQLTEC